MVYWITGLSGCGKTTTGNAIYEKLRKESSNILLLDGDDMRAVFCENLGYTYEERRVCAFRYARLCKYLSGQNMDIICTTVSMFKDVRKWNRENIENYCEIYLKCNHEKLIERDVKNVYKLKDVVGASVNAELPDTSDLIIDNSEKDVNEVVKIILDWREKNDKNRLGL